MQYKIIIALQALATACSAYIPSELYTRDIYEAGFQAGLEAREPLYDDHESLSARNAYWDAEEYVDNLVRRTKKEKPIKIHEDSTATRGRSPNRGQDRSGRLRSTSPVTASDNANRGNIIAGNGPPDGSGPGKENRAPNKRWVDVE